MEFNGHHNLKDSHSVLSPSNSSWVSYTLEDFEIVYSNRLAAEHGSRLHHLAAEMISLGIRPERNGKTFNEYVIDAIGWRMSPEVVLYYSENAFGTADAISFRDNLLRIHDLKTGKHPANPRQLLVYAAYFCLEYNKHPKDISMELRKYQNDEVTIIIPEAEEVEFIIDKAISFDRYIKDTNSRMEDIYG